jgi:hypothetical protein
LRRWRRRRNGYSAGKFRRSELRHHRIADSIDITDPYSNANPDGNAVIDKFLNALLV